MSSSGIKLICGQPQVEEGETDLVYFVPYRYAPVVDGHDTGGVRVAIDHLTETELNSIIQQAVADDANIQYPGNAFVATDVIGGRV